MTAPFDGLRFLGAAIVWLLPGWGLARVLYRGADPLARIAFAVSAAVASSTLLAFLAYLARVPADRFHLILYGAAAAALLSRLLPATRVRGDAAPAEAESARPAPGTRFFVIGSWCLLAFAGWRGGAAIRFTSDGPDHVGTIREILASGAFFPTEAFHVGAGILGADPRKGLLHPVYAALSAISGLDPIELWAWLPVLTAPFLYAAGYLFLRGLRARPGWAAAGAWLLLATWNGGLGDGLLAISPYPNQVGEGMFWATAGALLLALESGGTRRALGAALLLYGTVAVHAMYLVFLALFGLLLLIAVLVVRRAPAREIRFLVVSALWAALPLVPYLLVRRSMYAPANAIHTELQGMLLLGEGLFVADPLRIWGHVGVLGLVGYPLALVVLARRWRTDRGAFLAFWGTLGVLVFTFNPWLVGLAQRHLSYLVFRFSWLLPPAAAAIVSLQALRGANPALAPRSRRVALALLALGCLAALLTALPPRWLVRDTGRLDAKVDPLPWRPALTALAQGLPPRTVVLTDPITGYVLPALTPLKVTCTVDQHSTPNDSLAMRRMLDARNVLSAGTGPLEAARIFHGTGAAYALVNGRFKAPVLTATMEVRSGNLARRARELTASGVWERVTEVDGFVLLRPVAERAETSAVLPQDEERVPLRGPFLARGAGLGLVSARAEARQVARGDSVVVDLVWTPAEPPVPHAGVMASVRLDALDRQPRGLLAGKIGRKLDERLHGVLYRTRTDWLPGSGTSAIPPDLWPAGSRQPDRVALRVPHRLVPGRYGVSVGVDTFPHMPNHTLADYFSDRDLYSGEPVDTVIVVE